MNKIIKILMVLSLFGYIINIVNAETLSSYVDPGYGFYKIRDTNIKYKIDYNIVTKTLTINKGDSINWINDADNSIGMSIVSDQNLWNGALKLEKSYTFNIPGTYTFYIKEYPSDKQTIIVNSLDGSVPTPIETTNETPLSTHRPTTIPTVESQPTSIQTIASTPTQTPPSTHTPTQTPYIPKELSPATTPKITYTYPVSENTSVPVETLNYNLSTSPPSSSQMSIRPLMIVSIIVAIISIFITHKIGNK